MKYQRRFKKKLKKLTDYLQKYSSKEIDYVKIAKVILMQKAAALNQMS